jgi:hypothetical protein
MEDLFPLPIGRVGRNAARATPWLTVPCPVPTEVGTSDAVRGRFTPEQCVRDFAGFLTETSRTLAAWEVIDAGSGESLAPRLLWVGGTA